MHFDKASSPRAPTEEGHDDRLSVEEVIGTAIQERKWSEHAQKQFKTLDMDNNGFLGQDEFLAGYRKLKPELSEYLRVRFSTSVIWMVAVRSTSLSS